MGEEQIRLVVLILGFTLAAGVLDALAFTYSAGIWQGGRLVPETAFKSGIAFFLGIAMYWCAIRFLGEAGVVQPEIQTLVWFTVTIVGVTMLSGRFVQWPLVDQVIAFNALASLGWLVTRT